MAKSPKRYTEDFKRQAVARMTTHPGDMSTLADELGVSRTLLHRWRKQFAPAPPVSPLPEGEGPGVRAAVGPGVRAAVGPGVRLSGEAPEDEASAGPAVDAAANPRLRQSLLETAFALALAIRETTASAPLNQLSAALGIVIDRLLKLEALAPHESAAAGEEVTRIEYTYPDGSVHHRPPWAAGDPAFEEPISRGRVRSPFWEDGDGQADDPGDGPARG